VHLGGAERDLGELLHGQEVVGPEVGIAVAIAGVDAGDLDGDLDFGVCRVLGVEVN
jgi:hypothetical protein